MILNGAEILTGRKAGEIHIYPFNPENLGPNSYDVTLGQTIKEVLPNFISMIEPTDKQKTRTTEMDQEGGFIIYPGRLYLAHTVEQIGSEYYVPMLEGRSSIGRMGLFIHITAGFGDIGFKSQWTLELTSVLPIRIFPGMRIGQVFFHHCTSQTMMYDGRYTNQSGPQESLFWQKSIRN